MSVTEIHYTPSLVQAVAVPRHDFLESLDEASAKPLHVVFALHPMAPRGHGAVPRVLWPHHRKLQVHVRMDFRPTYPAHHTHEGRPAHLRERPRLEGGALYNAGPPGT